MMTSPQADYLQSVTARSVAAYRAGDGTLHLGGHHDAYHSTCSCCGTGILGADCYDIGRHWFHARCLAPLLDAAEEPHGDHEFVSVKLRVDIDGLGQRGDEGLAKRIEAAVKQALASIDVAGAASLKAYVRPVAMQRDSDLSPLNQAA